MSATTLSVDEAAALVGVSRRLVYKWAANGLVRPIRATDGSAARYREADVIAAAVAHRSGRQQTRLDRLSRRWQSSVHTG